MKVHKMSNKQFAKFVTDMQKQAMKNPLRLSFRFTDKYDYECKQGYFLCDADWIIRRKLGGTEQYIIWASHDPYVKLWYVREGDITYTYLDSDLEKEVQKDG